MLVIILYAKRRKERGCSRITRVRKENGGVGRRNPPNTTISFPISRQFPMKKERKTGKERGEMGNELKGKRRIEGRFSADMQDLWSRMQRARGMVK